MLHLPSTRVHRWLLHHLRQELLRLVTLTRSFLILALLLRLHSAIIEGVDPRVGATVDASIRGVQPLRLRGDRVGEIWAAGTPLEVLFRHRHVAACVEGRGAKRTILRAGELLLLKLSHLFVF